MSNEKNKNGFSLIEIMLFLSVIVGLLAGAFMLFKSVSEERSANQLISEWKSIHAQLDQTVTNMGDTKIKVFDVVSYNSFVIDQIVTSYPREERRYENDDGSTYLSKRNTLKTGIGALNVQLSPGSVKAPGPGENPFEATAPIQGYSIALEGATLDQKSCIKLGKSLLSLDYKWDVIIGNDLVYHYEDDEDTSNEDLNKRVIESCTIITSNPGGYQSIRGNYIYQNYIN